MLEFFNYRVTLAASGMEALDTLQQFGPGSSSEIDLVITDWKMPGLDGIETSKRILSDHNEKIPILMMTSFGQAAEKKAAEKVGIKGFLTKPVSLPTLYSSILAIFGKGSHVKTNGNKITTKASLHKKRLKGMKILVAEDNVTNQEIALAILEGAGMKVTIVENGVKAVVAVENEFYHAVLMDMQMPEMDGYEATRTIRKNSKFWDLPIIAMTAHAMKGDEEKCLEAGMNGYVSKPINQDNLFYTLSKKIIQAEETHEPDQSQGAMQGHESDEEAIAEQSYAGFPLMVPGINLGEAMDALGLDEATFKTILKGFNKGNTSSNDEMDNAFKEKDWGALQALAHSLKGSGSSIGARDLQKEADKLEIAAKEKNIPVIEGLVEVVKGKLDQVVDSIEKLIAPAGSSPAATRQKRIDPEQRIFVLKKLNDAFESYEYEEIRSCLDAVRENFTADEIKALQDQIESFDYTEAQETLEALLNKIKKG